MAERRAFDDCVHRFDQGSFQRPCKARKQHRTRRELHIALVSNIAVEQITHHRFQVNSAASPLLLHFNRFKAMLPPDSPKLLSIKTNRAEA